MPPGPSTRRSRWPLAALSLLVTFAIEAWLNAPLRAVPGGIVGLELARTPEAARHIIEVWSAADLVARARAGVWFDYAFLAAYGWFFRELILLSWIRRAGLNVWFARLPVLAAAFDAVENVGLLMMLGGRITTGWTTLAAVFAALKFFLLACALVYLAAGGLALAARRGSRRDPAGR